MGALRSRAGCRGPGRAAHHAWTLRGRPEGAGFSGRGRQGRRGRVSVKWPRPCWGLRAAGTRDGALRRWSRPAAAGRQSSPRGQADLGSAGKFPRTAVRRPRGWALAMPSRPGDVGGGQWLLSGAGWAAQVPFGTGGLTGLCGRVDVAAAGRRGAHRPTRTPGGSVRQARPQPRLVPYAAAVPAPQALPVRMLSEDPTDTPAPSGRCGDASARLPRGSRGAPACSSPLHKRPSRADPHGKAWERPAPTAVEQES